MDQDRPHALSDWKIGLSDAGNILLLLGHAGSSEDFLAGEGEWTHLVLSPQQAAALAHDLLKTEGRSPQMFGEEI